jgi:hypothetical protein
MMKRHANKILTRQTSWGHQLYNPQRLQPPGTQGVHHSEKKKRPYILVLIQTFYPKKQEIKATYEGI